MALREYEEARALAIKEKNPAAAVSAVNGKSKLFGLEKPTRLALGGDKDAPPIKTDGTAQLAALIEQIAERRGKAG
jgi:hypothetical protein